MTRSSAGRYRDALRRRDFTLMLTASLIDRIGSWAYNVVLIVYVYQRTGSVSWVAATTAAGWIPRIVFSAYAGVLAGRFERTRTLLVSTLLGLTLDRRGRLRLPARRRGRRGRRRARRARRGPRR
jgi:MFS family permease